MKAAKAACGWEVAIWSSLLISFVQVSTLLRTYSSVKDLEPMAALIKAVCTPKPIQRPYTYTQTFPLTAGRQRVSEIRTHVNSA